MIDEKVKVTGVIERACFVPCDDGGQVLDMEYRYEFQVNGQVYTVDPRSGITASEKTVPVLCASQNPARNFGLNKKRWAILSGAATPWLTYLVGMFVPAICITSLVWLWAGS